MNDLAQSLSIGEEVKSRLEENIKGLEVVISEYYEQAKIRLNYQCPCGETSHMMVIIDSGPKIIADHLIDRFTKELRQHVISEGNTPDF